jgi:hypothetical protein
MRSIPVSSYETGIGNRSCQSKRAAKYEHYLESNGSSSNLKNATIRALAKYIFGNVRIEGWK